MEGLVCSEDISVCLSKHLLPVKLHICFVQHGTYLIFWKQIWFYYLPITLQKLFLQVDELINIFLMKADTLLEHLAGITEVRIEMQYPAIKGLQF